MPSDDTDESGQRRSESGVPHLRFGLWTGVAYALPAAFGTLLLGTGLWELFAVVSGTLVRRTGELNHSGHVLRAFAFAALGWGVLLWVLSAVAHRTLADA